MIGAHWAASSVAAPADVARLAHEVGAAGLVTFGGQLQRQTAKGLIGTVLARTRLAGDYRDWDGTRRWRPTSPVPRLVVLDRPQRRSRPVRGGQNRAFRVTNP
jgi:hypothetical protein